MNYHKMIFPLTFIILLITTAFCWSPVPSTENRLFRRSVEENVSSTVSNNKCANVSPSILAEIQRYRPTVEKIGTAILNGSYKGVAYNNLTDFVDTYGARLTGSESLEKAIDHVLATMTNIGLDNVHSEDVIAPKWVR